jgi:dTMP kinase
VFITFEGIEGCGKTTQAALLAEFLSERSIPYLVTREPGGTRLGKLIRQILLDPAHSVMEPLTELFLYAADRSQHIAQVIRPTLEAGHWVLCDRFADATTAYQGYGRDQDLDFIQTLNQMATQGLWPNISLLLDCPVEIGLSRARQRILESALQGQEDRFEQQGQPFHQKVREGYLQIAAQHSERFRVLDGALKKQQLHDQIVALLQPYLHPTQLNR